MEFFNNICILCLVRNKKIKSVSLKDDDGVVVEEKLKYILFELVNFNPEVPKYICIDCLKDLNYVYKFKQKCFQNLMTLNDQMKKISAHNNKNNKSEDHNVVNLVECNIEINEDNLGTKHLKENIAKEEVVIKSEEIDIDTDKRFDILFFDEIHTEYSQNTKNVTGNDNYNIKCSTSIMINDDESYIKQETEEFEDTNNEINPLQTPGEGTFKKINIKDILQTQATRISDRITIQPICIDGTKKLYKCTHCTKTFLKKYNFAEHFRTHTGEKPYICDICNKAYSHKSSLIIHQRTHSGDRPYQCEVCDRAFIRKNHYNYHKLKHTGEKAHECGFCSYRCTTSSGLNSHVRRRHSDQTMS